MFRRKRIASLPKPALVIVIKRTLAPERILQSVSRGKTIDRRLACQESRLPFVFVLRHMSPDVHSGADTDKPRQPGVSKIFAVFDPRGRIRQMLFKLGIRSKQAPSQSTHRQQPIRVRRFQMKWARPDRLLIIDKVLYRRETDSILMVAIRRCRACRHGLRLGALGLFLRTASRRPQR